MLTVSEQYKNAIKGYSRQFELKATFDNIEVDGNHLISVDIEDSFNADNNILGIGNAVSKKATIKMYVVDNIPYSIAPIKIESGLYLENDTVEWVEMGTYYPAEVETEDNYTTITITAYDRLSKLNKLYQPTVSLPTTDTAIINDICVQNGMSFVGESLNFPITEIYENTEREVLGYLAGIQGMNVCITRDNKLDFRWYLMPRKWESLDGKKTWLEIGSKTWAEISRIEQGGV